MASSLLRASPLSLLSRLKPLNPRPPASHLRRLLLCTSTSASCSPSPLRTLAAAAATGAATPPEEAAPAAEAKLERMQPLQWPPRDALCGDIGAGDAGRRVRLCGWVALRRTHAGLTFLTLRDCSGMVQCLLGVLGSCPPAVRCNASDGMPSARLPPLFHRSVLPGGYVLGSLRYCHAGVSEGSRDVCVSEVLKILKSSDGDTELGEALRHFANDMDEDVVLKVLQKQRSNWQAALSFFNWAAGLPGYTHDSRAYTEMLDILGRMKKVRLMRQLFDEIPEECRRSVVTNRMFAVLLNRYAGAHKVQEAIEMFHKRKDYGFELDLVGFQILLMSLCRYKHVEEAEALFLQKKDEFPPVIKSWNIILNGWCVKGSLVDAKRVWNEIIASKLKPDLFTYGTFINSLAKAGKLSTAVKLFSSMWEKGINPDVAICNCIIDQLCFKKRIPEALNIFGEMNDRGCQADVATYNTLIKYLCKIKRMDKVYELVDAMEEKGCSPNNMTYSYILKTTQKPKDVIILLQRMEKSGCKLDSDTYNLILNLYVSWKYEKGVQQVWDEMESSGSGPDQRSFTIMVHGLHSQGKLDEALQYYTTMKSRGMIPEPRTRILVKAIHMKKGASATENQSPSLAGKNLKLDPLSRLFHVHK